MIAIVGMTKDGEATLGPPGEAAQRYADRRSARLDREAAEHRAERRRRTGRSNLDRVVSNPWSYRAARKCLGAGRIVMLFCDSYFGLLRCGRSRRVPQVAVAIPWASTWAQAECNRSGVIRADLADFRRASVRIVVMMAGA